MIYYISDTHFDHENVIQFCDRPFERLEAMNALLIANWNHKVKGNDAAYILGNLFFRCEEPESILRQLKGKKQLIVGNHDSSRVSKLNASRYFERIDYMLETSVSKVKLSIRMAYGFRNIDNLVSCIYFRCNDLSIALPGRQPSLFSNTL